MGRSGYNSETSHKTLREERDAAKGHLRQKVPGVLKQQGAKDKNLETRTLRSPMTNIFLKSRKL